MAKKFGNEAGDKVVYRPWLKRNFVNAILVWRFKLDKGENISFKMAGTVRREIIFQGTGTFSTVAVSLGKLNAGECEFIFTSTGGAGLALNGFALVEKNDVDQLNFIPKPWHQVPEINSANASGGLILKYQDATNSYGFKLAMPLAGHRQLKWRDLDAAFGTEPGPNTTARIFGDLRRGRAGDSDSLFIHAFSKPFTIAPNSQQVIYGLICEGTDAQVRHSLAEFNPNSSRNERIYLSAKKKKFIPASTPSGEEFKFSQRLMAATTLTNVVYPLYTQRNYIRHCAPGKSWDCLYTWDAGFTGLGLLEIDLQSAIEVLYAYTTPPGAQSAFILHGTPLPVQIFLFYELWNRTQSRELLEYFYQ
jgi:hypothetical protein